MGAHYSRVPVLVPGIIVVAEAIIALHWYRKGYEYVRPVVYAMIVGCVVASAGACLFLEHPRIAFFLEVPLAMMSSAALFSFMCIAGGSFDRILASVFTFMINCAVSSAIIYATYLIDGNTIENLIASGVSTSLEINYWIVLHSAVSMFVCLVALAVIRRYMKSKGINRFDRDFFLKEAEA